jgi:hypothetical protein
MISELCNSLLLTYLASEYLVACDAGSGHSSSSSPHHYHNNNNNNNTIHGRRLDDKMTTVSFLMKKRLTMTIIVVLVIVINIFDRMVGFTEWFHSIMITDNHVMHILSWPLKIVLAASCYVGTLYIDIHRKIPLLSLLYFSIQQQQQRNTATINTINNINHRGERIDCNIPTNITTLQINNDTNQQQQHQQLHSAGRIMPCSKYLPKVGYAFCRVLPAYPFLAVGMSVIFLFLIHVWEWLHLPLEWLQNPIYYGTLYGPFAYTYLHVKRQVLSIEAHTLPT